MVYVELPWEVDGNICNVKNLELSPDSNEYGVITVDIKSATEMCFYGEVVTTTPSDTTIYSGNYTQVAFSDGTNFKYVYDFGSNLSNFKENNSEYDPIGIVVIPASCSTYVYPTTDARYGKNIIMSLATMSYTTPDTGGTTNENLFWGAKSDSLSVYPVVPNYGENISSEITYTINGNIPTFGNKEIDNSVVDSYNNKLYYRSSQYLCPAPFKLSVLDNGFVPDTDYFSSVDGYSVATSDLAGPYNTKKFIDSATSQTDWKIKGTTITNSYSSGYYPAACCCARYGAPDNSSAPKGTCSLVKYVSVNPSFSGDNGVAYVWYAPALGELGFAIPFMEKKFLPTLKKLKSIYSDSKTVTINDVDESNYDLLFSSTQHGNNGFTVWAVSQRDGLLYTNYQTYDNLVRAFCAIP